MRWWGRKRRSAEFHLNKRKRVKKVSRPVKPIDAPWMCSWISSVEIAAVGVGITAINIIKPPSSLRVIAGTMFWRVTIMIPVHCAELLAVRRDHRITLKKTKKERNGGLEPISLPAFSLVTSGAGITSNFEGEVGGFCPDGEGLVLGICLVPLDVLHVDSQLPRCGREKMQEIVACWLKQRVNGVKGQWVSNTHPSRTPFVCQSPWSNLSSFCKNPPSHLFCVERPTKVTEKGN